MWPFTRKPGKRVLTILTDREELAVEDRDLPAERELAVEIRPAAPRLAFRDSAGQEYAYDLTPILQEGFSWLHLGVQVHEVFTVECDALLWTSSNPPTQRLEPQEGKAVRFQPFFLPEFKGEKPSLPGRGLFFRGFHTEGLVTPGYVSLFCLCDRCRKSFRVQSFHAGFGQVVYFYCERAPHTLAVSSYADGAPQLLNKPDPESLAKFEARLPKCARCGGAFRYLNPFRCPHCKAPYIDFEKYPDDREVEYYGNYLYGEALQEWQG